MNSTIAADDTPVIRTTPGFEDDVKLPFSIFLLIQLIVGILGILGNSLVCIVFLSCRSLRNQTNLLVTNQAFVDLLSSVLIILRRVYSLIPSPPPEPSSATIVLFLYCYLWKSQLLQFASFSISTINLTAIAVERYVAILYPHSYSRIFTRRNVKNIIPMIWLFAPVLQYVIVSTTFSLKEGVCIIGWATRSVGILLFLGEYLIPVFVMIFSFVSILRKFRSIARVVTSTTMNTTTTQASRCGQQTHGATTTSDPKEDGDKLTIGRTSTHWHAGSSISPQNRALFQPSVAAPSSSNLPGPAHPINRPENSTVNRTANRVTDVRRRNVTMTLLVVSVMFIVCWSPNQLAYFQLNLGGHLDFVGNFYQISLALALCNSCVNPFIYALRHKAYKERVRELYRKLTGSCCTSGR